MFDFYREILVRGDQLARRPGRHFRLPRAQCAGDPPIAARRQRQRGSERRRLQPAGRRLSRAQSQMVHRRHGDHRGAQRVRPQRRSAHGQLQPVRQRSQVGSGRQIRRPALQRPRQRQEQRRPQSHV